MKFETITTMARITIDWNDNFALGSGLNPQFFPPQISGLITIISSWLTLELPHNFLTFLFFLNLQILVSPHKCFHPGAIPPPPNGQCPIAYNRPSSTSGSCDQNSKPEGGCGFVQVWFCLVNFINGIIC